jgi:hypothetical protein
MMESLQRQVAQAKRTYVSSSDLNKSTHIRFEVFGVVAENDSLSTVIVISELNR